MSVTEYAEFIARKERRAQPVGVDVAREDLHPLLHDWQAEGVRWALKTGRSALFWDCGLGKTFAQIEWARHSGRRTLILAPLSVARQTVREAAKLDIDVAYVRDPSRIDRDGVFITNYEIADRFDPASLDAVVLDESSILKNVDGRTRRLLTDMYARVPRRLACSATPAPNDVAELANHAEFLSAMSRPEMLASFFVNDEREWRLKGHAKIPMFRWLSTWAHALRRPSDAGYPDDGYQLPALEIVSEIVEAEVTPGDGQLFAYGLGGIGGRSRVRKETLEPRVERAVQLAQGDEQWIIWCGLNEEAAQVARDLDGAVNVEGAWTPDRKAEALEAFQDGSVRVLVTKPSIAGFGMNFQNASRMAFVGLSDSYESYYQAIRRCWRFGQTQPVRAHVVVSEIEQEIVENVRRKERDTTAFTDQLIHHMNNARMEAAA